MPATTPNRLYPYPVPADGVDIPGDIQRLAEAVDADLCDLTQNIPLRYAFRVRGSTPQAVVTSGVFNPTNLLTFDTIDFSTGTNPTLASEGRAIVPALTGLYWVIGTVAYPRPTGGIVSRTRFSLFLRRNQFPTFPIHLRSDQHILVPASDGIRNLYVAGAVSTTPAGGFALDFASQLLAGGTDTFTVTERTLTFIRMSPTP